MGLAKLDIWVSEMEDPCGVDDEHTWYVFIFDCDGRVLNWCGRSYAAIPARCGHLEVDVPPGIYYIKAVWWAQRVGLVYHVNHFTDAAIVNALHGEAVSVKLFNPSLHRCGHIFVGALRALLKHRGIKPELVKEQEALMNKILADVPAPKKGFELESIDKIEELIAAQEKQGTKA